MTKKETSQILAVLKAAYPNSYKGMTKDEARGTVTVWWTQLSTVAADIVLMALQKCISVCKFPPTVCEVREQIDAIRNDAEMWLGSMNACGLSEEAKNRFRYILDNAQLPVITLQSFTAIGYGNNEPLLMEVTDDVESSAV